MTPISHVLATGAFLALVLLPAFVLAGAGQDATLARYAALAKADDAAFAAFSADRGEAFFRAEHGTGNPEITACTSCHTADPAKEGHTRAGQSIAPMAVSVTPDRFGDFAKVEKWFRRNCETVLGRQCTALEKGDFIAFMTAR
jgi:hypothetical protein